MGKYCSSTWSQAEPFSISSVSENKQTLSFSTCSLSSTLVHKNIVIIEVVKLFPFSPPPPYMFSSSVTTILLQLQCVTVKSQSQYSFQHLTSVLVDSETLFSLFKPTECDIVSFSSFISFISVTFISFISSLKSIPLFFSSVSS